MAVLLLAPVLLQACATKGFVRKEVAAARLAGDSAMVAERDARPMLERFATVAKKYYPRSVITVEGFADPAGTRAYNLNLSQARAANVKATLETLGLGGDAVRVVAYGEERQVNPGAEKDEPGAVANRRVVFVIESAGTEAAIALAPMK